MKPSAASDAIVCSICSLPKPSMLRCRVCDEASASPRALRGPLAVAQGFLLFFRALFELLQDRRHRRILAYASLASFVLSLGAIALFGYGAYGYVSEWTTELPDWLSLGLSWGAVALALLLTIGLGLYLFPTLASICLFPTLEPLSRSGEERILGWAPPPSTRGFWGDSWDAVLTLFFTLLWQTLALLLIIPIALTGIASLPVAMAISSFFAGFAWIDYPLARRGLGFRAKWRISVRNGFLLCGFGLGFQALLFVPVLGLFLAIPTAALGSASLYYHLSKSSARDSRS